MPVLAIEVISASQDIQDVLEEAERLVAAGVDVVWTVEPFTRTIFVTTEAGEVIHREPRLESKGVIVDFQRLFADGKA